MKTKYITFCKRCNTETEHYASGSCIKCKKERAKDYYSNNKEKRKEWTTKNKEKLAAWKAEHKLSLREFHRQYTKEYRLLHPELKLKRKLYAYQYYQTDLNNLGITKGSIRGRSAYILYVIRKHTKLENYEIHHCFGYDDPNKFIYIPKDLHLMIYQRLKDLNISADSNHYNYIVDLINECQDYTYISI